MQISFAIHILGLIFWVGGLIVLSRFLKVFATVEVAPSEEDEFLSAIKKACSASYFGFVVPGAVMTLVTGTYQLLSIGMSYYMKQGWFHGKATAIILLLVITVLAGLQVGKVERGSKIQRKMITVIHGGAAGITLAILLLTYIGRAA